MSYNPSKKALRTTNFKPRYCHTSPLFKENVILKLTDKVHLENILFVNKSINNLFPTIFNDWFTLVSVQHSYQASSSTKEKLFNPPAPPPPPHLRLSPMVKICCSKLYSVME